MPREKFPPPSDLDKTSKDLWRRTRKQLEGQKTWSASDVPTLERYIRAMERARIARNELPKKKGGGRKLTTTGSQGQLVPHPSVKTAREAERDAHEYARDLLLTPKSREQNANEKGSSPKKAGKFGGAFG